MTKGGWSWADLTSAPPGQMIYRKDLTGIWESGPSITFLEAGVAGRATRESLDELWAEGLGVTLEGLKP